MLWDPASPEAGSVPREWYPKKALWSRASHDRLRRGVRNRRGRLRHPKVLFHRSGYFRVLAERLHSVGDSGLFHRPAKHLVQIGRRTSPSRFQLVPPYCTTPCRNKTVPSPLAPPPRLRPSMRPELDFANRTCPDGLLGLANAIECADSSNHA